MASIYSNIAGDNFTDRIVTAAQNKNAGSSLEGLGNATIWGAIINAGSGKSTTHTKEGGDNNLIVIALVAVVLILMLD
ncbi:MAG: hypothetical protein IKN49_04550 [Elusimicrobiaceae bacterium]|nr:hypothetical protein [Candidatus Saccharibacteria bacterium]MBR3204224.1 hypothetical protein [Candidatus Saccharibacteria bacterium]MBR3632306.1 hypothetical protein [Elusimicrobiaceae bacterium]